MVKLFFSLFCFISFANGHPHTFIDVNVTLSSIEMQIAWHFDEMTSHALLEDFDEDHDGIFNATETLNFKKEVFDALKQFSYFTHIKINTKKITFTPKNLHLMRDGNTFVVKFAVDLKNYEHQKKSIGFWDEEYLCALSLTKEHIFSSSKFTLKAVDNAYYYGYLLELQ